MSDTWVREYLGLPVPPDWDFEKGDFVFWHRRRHGTRDQMDFGTVVERVRGSHYRYCVRFLNGEQNEVREEELHHAIMTFSGPVCPDYRWLTFSYYSRAKPTTEVQYHWKIEF